MRILYSTEFNYPSLIQGKSSGIRYQQGSAGSAITNKYIIYWYIK